MKYDLIINDKNHIIEHNLLGARDDVDVIQAWFSYSCSNSIATEISYKKEIKRFLIYCEYIKKHYTEIDTLDINNYLGLLASPPSDWLKPTIQTIEPKKTQVLKKALSLKSVQYTKMVLHGFYSYIHSAKVISNNPVSISVKIKVEKMYGDNISEKSLSLDAWHFLSDWLKSQSLNTKNPNRMKAIRDRWLMHFLYYTGARRSSAVGLTMDCFLLERVDQSHVWTVNFKMKGNKRHKIIAISQLMAELSDYRKSIGLSSTPIPTETNIPVIASLTKNQESIYDNQFISNRGVNYVIEQSLLNAAKDCDNEYIAQELYKATPHTFRHTCASHQLHYGIDVTATQKHLGHANINTTMLYANKTMSGLVDMSNELSRAIKTDRG